MKNKLSKTLSSLTVALLAVGTLSSPAMASLPAFADRLDVTSGTFEVGPSTAEMSITISDSDGKIFGPSANISAGELRTALPFFATCTTVPTSERLPMNGSGCSTYLIFSGISPTVTGGGASVTLGYTEASPSWRSLLTAGTRIYFGVEVQDSSGQKIRVILLSSANSSSAPEQVSPETDPGVSFAGFLISGASGRVVAAETAGTLRFAGKRLNQVTGATIGGIAVTVTSATRSALVLDFDSLPEGKHDVVLTSKSGAKTTLRGFVTVN